MNSKRTNYFVAILNVLAIVAYYNFVFSASYMDDFIMSTSYGGKSIYNSEIIETLFNGIQVISFLVFGALGVLNIVCAIQNKDDKKLCFWQSIFGVYGLWNAITVSVLYGNDNIVEYGNKILFGIIPLIFVIKNFIGIRKNGAKLIQIISYIMVVVLSILNLLDFELELSTVILDMNLWDIIAVIMQFIYIHKQERNIEESKLRKVINIILYYFLQTIIVLGFLFIIITSLVVTKNNDMIWEREVSNLINKKIMMQGISNKEIFIPVIKNGKYGFINDNGIEKIPCQYDRVSYFNEITINNMTYHIALAKKDNKYYLISKSNNAMLIDNNLEKYIVNLDEFWTNGANKVYTEYGSNSGYIQAFEAVFENLLRNLFQFNLEDIEQIELKEVNLTEQEEKYYYNNENYTMIIETMDEDYYETLINEYKVTIQKNNGETYSNIEGSAGFSEIFATMTMYSDGYIGFISTDSNDENKYYGWYDNNGNKMWVSAGYTLLDVRDNKVFLLEYKTSGGDEENFEIDEMAVNVNYLIVDFTGQVLVNTPAIDRYENFYLIKNVNNKMVLIDRELNVISNEYDKIITNFEIDTNAYFSSYY